MLKTLLESAEIWLQDKNIGAVNGGAPASPSGSPKSSKIKGKRSFEVVFILLSIALAAILFMICRKSDQLFISKKNKETLDE